MEKKSTTKHCCWGVCKSDTRYPDRMPEGTTFFPFAKPGRLREGMTKWEQDEAKKRTDRAKRWLHACGRKDFANTKQITKDTYICSLHFEDPSGPTEENPDPILATLTEKEAESRMKRRRKLKERCLDLDAIHSKKAKDDVACVAENSFDIAEGDLSNSLDKFKSSNFEASTSEVATQTMYDKYVIGAKIETMVLKNEARFSGMNKKHEINSMSPQTILASRKMSKIFLGLYPDQFDALYNFLGPAKFHLRYWRPDASDNDNEGGSAELKSIRTRRFGAKEELFLTLLELRRGFAHQTIAYIYGISVPLVSRIFITWIQFIYLHFRELKSLMFPSREILNESLPPVFKSFKNVRCLVDCTEFYCQTPRDYARQGNIYSSYKHHATFKALIAVTPNGSA